MLASSGVQPDSDNALCKQRPLQIQVGNNALSCFKPPWTLDACKVAIKSTGYFEAGGNLTWINPELVTDADSLPKLQTSWGEVDQLANTFFSRECAGFHGVQPGDSPRRLIFPSTPLSTWVAEAGAIQSEWFPSTLRLTVGQPIVCTRECTTPSFPTIRYSRIVNN